MEFYNFRSVFSWHVLFWLVLHTYGLFINLKHQDGSNLLNSKIPLAVVHFRFVTQQFFTRASNSNQFSKWEQNVFVALLRSFNCSSCFLLFPLASHFLCWWWIKRSSFYSVSTSHYVCFLYFTFFSNLTIQISNESYFNFRRFIKKILSPFFYVKSCV